MFVGEGTPCGGGWVGLILKTIPDWKDGHFFAFSQSCGAGGGSCEVTYIEDGCSKGAQF